jgi:hypothetical protein
MILMMNMQSLLDLLLGEDLTHPFSFHVLSYAILVAFVPLYFMIVGLNASGIPPCSCLRSFVYF